MCFWGPDSDALSESVVYQDIERNHYQRAGNIFQNHVGMRKTESQSTVFPVLPLRSCVGIFKGTLGNKEPNSCWMYIHINIFNFLFLFKTKARPHAQECTVQEWPWLQPGTENGRGKEVSEAAAGCCWAVLWAVSVPATGFLSIRWKKPTYHCLWFQLGASLMLAILL